MSPDKILFFVIAAFTLFSAAMVVSARRMMHSALWLVLALMGVAVFFAMLNASFFAITQVLVYIGAIAILIIFAMMLTRRAMQDIGPQVNKNWWIPAFGMLVLFVGLLIALHSWQVSNTLVPELASRGENLPELGKALVAADGFVIPFEVASILILGGLIGAIFLGKETEVGKK